MSVMSEFPAESRAESPADSRADSPVDSPADRAPPPVQQKILVWDLPTRVFHWCLVLGFGGAYLTAEGERWRMVHVSCGYMVAALLGFRLLWGLIGSRHARFAAFVRGPLAVLRYLRALLRGTPEHYTGHNPAGALAIVALLMLGLLVCASGWAIYQDLAGGWVEELHEASVNVMLAIVGLHVAGVLMASFLYRENLVGAMFTGRKPGRPEDGIRRAWRGVALLLLAALLAIWWLQWQSLPAPAQTDARALVTQSTAHDRDDD